MSQTATKTNLLSLMSFILINYEHMAFFCKGKASRPRNYCIHDIITKWVYCMVFMVHYFLNGGIDTVFLKLPEGINI